MSDLTDALADGALASEGFVFTNALSVSESGIASDSVSWIHGNGWAFSEKAKATESWSYGSAAFASLLSESATAGDQWSVRRSVSLSSSATASASFTASFLPKIVQSAKASECYTAQTNYHLALSGSAKASEAWAYVEVALSGGDTARASDQITVEYTANTGWSDAAHGSDLLTPVRGLNLLMSEEAEGIESFVLSIAYQVTLIELGYVREFIEPSGSYTAWAINTRTNAVTEYRNFHFNSAVNMGRKYLVANEEGIFELDGPTDEGNVNVLATISGGYFRANGNKYAGLKGVYVGVGGQGPGSASGSWLLTLTLGDGRDYTYRSQSNPALMTSKINIGKGLRASYMAWSLSNADGQDFDLDNIEFVPMMSGRRVG